MKVDILPVSTILDKKQYFVKNSDINRQSILQRCIGLFNMNVGGNPLNPSLGLKKELLQLKFSKKNEKDEILNKINTQLQENVSKDISIEFDESMTLDLTPKLIIKINNVQVDIFDTSERIYSQVKEFKI